MHKSNVKILQILNDNQCTNEIKSFSILKILSFTNYKYSKVYNDLNNLLMANYIGKGFKSERADTFYIKQEGINYLKKIYL